ncbi:precorrin-2 C20-methyltransferase [Acidimicrobium ferrooxidans DSM 10331]|uniref:Precorrin-2 C20-methyltransferase n=1 Tax=Acidimicrobium ferrooxidans (strain DSM 10331 / JCM 15462 / NBRC 103882 / ICP) TaxID=525909 RepID=C7M3A2_ACIFD|nr:precorrin-2 C(20)-methyltransferase [Acidimicrobium ferrooxidans]ACU53496.1 precorrin-2 C20-methyltransferase [Acidimicrobium ferrooxidans DSM 10331]
MVTAQGRLIGVGVGPGDPDLVTVRAVRTLERARLVLAPTLDAASPGRAERICREAAPSARIERVVMPMTSDAEASSRRRASAAEVAPLVVAALEVGGDVAWVTLGDPGIYSTFWLLVDAVHALAPDVLVEVVPGVVAFSALAAAAGVELLDDADHLVLATGRTRTEVVDAALADPDSALVLYKPGRQVQRVREAVASSDRRAVVGWLLGTPEAEIRPLAEAPDEVPYLTTVLVAPRRPRA